MISQVIVYTVKSALVAGRMSHSLARAENGSGSAGQPVIAWCCFSVNKKENRICQPWPDTGRCCLRQRPISEAHT